VYRGAGTVGIGTVVLARWVQVQWCWHGGYRCSGAGTVGVCTVVLARWV
jgi:hypothetical protein